MDRAREGEKRMPWVQSVRRDDLPPTQDLTEMHRAERERAAQMEAGRCADLARDHELSKAAEKEAREQAYVQIAELKRQLDTKDRWYKELQHTCAAKLAAKESRVQQLRAALRERGDAIRRSEDTGQRLRKENQALHDELDKAKQMTDTERVLIYHRGRTDGAEKVDNDSKRERDREEKEWLQKEKRLQDKWLQKEKSLQDEIKTLKDTRPFAIPDIMGDRGSLPGRLFTTTAHQKDASPTKSPLTPPLTAARLGGGASIVRVAAKACVGVGVQADILTDGWEAWQAAMDEMRERCEIYEMLLRKDKRRESDQELVRKNDALVQENQLLKEALHAQLRGTSTTHMAAWPLTDRSHKHTQTISTIAELTGPQRNDKTPMNALPSIPALPAVLPSEPPASVMHSEDPAPITQLKRSRSTTPVRARATGSRRPAAPHTERDMGRAAGGDGAGGVGGAEGRLWLRSLSFCVGTHGTGMP